MSRLHPEGPSAGPAGADAQHVQLAEHPQNDGTEGPPADCHCRRIRRCPAEERGNLLGECDLIHELSLLQRHQRHEPSAPQRQRADVPSRHQHPEQRRLDLRLTVRPDDVLPGAQGSLQSELAEMDECMPHYYKITGEPRAGRGKDHAGGGGVHAGPLHRRAHRTGERLRPDRGQRAGEHGALLRLSGAAALSACTDVEQRCTLRGALRGAAAAAQRRMAQHLERHQRLLPRPAGRDGQDPGGLRAAPALHRPISLRRASP